MLSGCPVGFCVYYGLNHYHEDSNKGFRQMTVSEHDIHYLEIVTPDAEASCDFYGQTYGWRFEKMAPELGGAFVAVLPNGSLCGIRAPMHELEKPTVRTYVRESIFMLPSKRPGNWALQLLLSPRKYREEA